MLPAMGPYTRNVLVVEPNPIERERLAGALEGEGFQAFLCSGPTQPDYSCLGVRSPDLLTASGTALALPMPCEHR